MSINERIKKLRKAKGLTQVEFAEQIGSSQKSVTGYETGRRNPSSSVINNICKTFSVNEEWLRTGIGEMFVPRVVDYELSAFITKSLPDVPDNIRRRFITALAVLNDEDLRAVERFALALVAERKQVTDGNSLKK